MSREIALLPKEKMKILGHFDFRYFYKQLYIGLNRDGWTVKEKRYVEKAKPGAEKKDIEIEWVATLPVDSYTMAKMEIFFEIKDSHEPMTEWKGGITRPIFEGIFEMKFYYHLVLDYQNKWAANPLLKQMQNFYERRIYKRNLDLIKEEHWKNGWDYIKNIKELLGGIAIHEVAPIHEIPLRED